MNAITIVGGGLSGLALGGVLQRSGIPTTIREAGRYPRHRVCGEFIAGLDSRDADSLDLHDCLADARHLLSVAWFHRGRRICEFRLPHAALGLSRHRLDSRLVSRFLKAGGHLETGRRATQANDGPGTVWTNGHPATRAPFLGLKAHVGGLELSADLEMHLANRGYVGLCQVESGVTNICGLFERRPIHGRSDSLLRDYIRASGLQRLGDDLETCTIIAESSCATAGLDYGAAGKNGPMLTLGDARQLKPPFTGGGMAAALASASEAVDPLRRYARGVSNWSETVHTVQLRLRHRLDSPARMARLIHPFLLNPRRQVLPVTLARFGVLPFGLLFRLLH